MFARHYRAASLAVLAIFVASLSLLQIGKERVGFAVEPTNTPTYNRAPAAKNSAVYPLKSSSNGRYLVDQNNTPFLMVGDSAWMMAGNLSEADAATYLANRQAAGFNAVLLSVLISSYIGGNSDGTTYDGIAPFTTPGDLSTPNNTYFARIDQMVQLAVDFGMMVLLDPIETGGWLVAMRNSGSETCYNYGVYLGNRYKNIPNIIWLHGNDFQTWTTASDDALVQAVARGIQSVDPLSNQMHTVELDYNDSGSLEDSTWAPLINVDSAYSYYPQYVRVLTEYNRNSMPVLFLEGVYEFQGYSGGYSGPHELRAQEYWGMLSGALAGQLYGNASLYPFPASWQTSLNTKGVTQLGYFVNLFVSRPWYNLVPDQGHSVVTAGYGTYDTGPDLGNTSNYLTAARTPDGSLVIAYMPTSRQITVDMTSLSGPVQASWYDPTDGTYATVSGSPFPNTGKRQFTPPGNNRNGDGDWALLLETELTPTPTNTATPTATPTSALRLYLPAVFHNLH